MSEAKPQKVSIEEIINKQTERGGWTRETLEKWGVPWPPKRGWIGRLVRGEQQ